MAGAAQGGTRWYLLLSTRTGGGGGGGGAGAGGGSAAAPPPPHAHDYPDAVLYRVAGREEALVHGLHCVVRGRAQGEEAAALQDDSAQVARVLSLLASARTGVPSLPADGSAAADGKGGEGEGERWAIQVASLPSLVYDPLAVSLRPCSSVPPQRPRITAHSLTSYHPSTTPHPPPPCSTPAVRLRRALQRTRRRCSSTHARRRSKRGASCRWRVPSGESAALGLTSLTLYVPSHPALVQSGGRSSEEDRASRRTRSFTQGDCSVKAGATCSCCDKGGEREAGAGRPSCPAARGRAAARDSPRQAQHGRRGGAAHCPPTRRAQRWPCQQPWGDEGRVRRDGGSARPPLHALSTSPTRQAHSAGRTA